MGGILYVFKIGRTKLKLVQRLKRGKLRLSEGGRLGT